MPSQTGGLRPSGSAATNSTGEFIVTCADHWPGLAPGARGTVSDGHDTVSDALAAVAGDRLTLHPRQRARRRP